MRTGEPIRVLHLSVADARGGATIAAYRLHRAMVEDGVDSRMLVCRKYTDDPTVTQLITEPRADRLRKVLTRAILGTHRTGNPVIRSLNVLPTGVHRIINRMAGDIVQMHWVNADTISIGEMARLNKQVVWTLHDMWAFSGAEHYHLPNDPERYSEGYRTDNRPFHESGWDLNRSVWDYKRLRWRSARFAIVCPSRWLAECARRSVIFGGSDVHRIPNPVDLSVYRPLPKSEARAAFGLPQDRRLILFGALYATTDRRKGFHHLQKALSVLRTLVGSEFCDLVVMGATRRVPEQIEGFRVHSLGRLEDDKSIVLGHNVADVSVLPSETDNLPNAVTEATSCGVPCVGFNIGGMPDMVAHMETGFLATPYAAEELAAGIRWVLHQDPNALSTRVRTRAVDMHSPSRCVERYLDLYRPLLAARIHQVDAKTV